LFSESAESPLEPVVFLLPLADISNCMIYFPVVTVITSSVAVVNCLFISFCYKVYPSEFIVLVIGHFAGCQVVLEMSDEIKARNNE